MDKLIDHLNAQEAFKIAVKKMKQYKQVLSASDPTPNTFYIHQGANARIITKLSNDKETHDVVRQGDYVITGPLREKYVVKSQNVLKVYNIIDGYLFTRQVQREVAHVPKSVFVQLGLPNPLRFITSWGVPMILKPGDYLVKDGNNHYRVEKKAFHLTYEFL